MTQRIALQVTGRMTYHGLPRQVVELFNINLTARQVTISRPYCQPLPVLLRGSTLLARSRTCFFQEHTPSGVVEFEPPMMVGVHGQATLHTQTGHR